MVAWWCVGPQFESEFDFQGRLYSFQSNFLSLWKHLGSNQGPTDLQATSAVMQYSKLENQNLLDIDKDL